MSLGEFILGPKEKRRREKRERRKIIRGGRRLGEKKSKMILDPFLTLCSLYRSFFVTNSKTRIVTNL